jgi:poly-gamma-glutamate system protein
MSLSSHRRPVRPDLGQGSLRRRILLAGLVGLLAWAGVGLLPRVLPAEAAAMVAAARRMEAGTAAVRTWREEHGPPIDEAADPNRTGLIGPEAGAWMTTLGSLPAKRTAASPELAALIARLFRQAGVRGGDGVAVGASGSFPGLLVATLSAIEAVGARPLTILSLGASTWGATDPDFDLLVLHRILERAGLAPGAPLRITPGGGEDVGGGLEPPDRSRLLERVRSCGLPGLEEADLRSNVAQRMAVYERAAGPGGIKAFVNAGGSWANLGTSPLALALRPGLNTHIALPPEEERGVLDEMAARGVPVIHLLNLRGLADRYGLAWDPVPLPDSHGSLFIRARSRPAGPVTLITVVLLVLLGVLLWPRRVAGGGMSGGGSVETW